MTQYVERLEYFFEANGITDAEKKRSVFLSVHGRPFAFQVAAKLGVASQAVREDVRAAGDYADKPLQPKAIRDRAEISQAERIRRDCSSLRGRVESHR